MPNEKKVKTWVEDCEKARLHEMLSSWMCSLSLKLKLASDDEFVLARHWTCLVRLYGFCGDSLLAETRVRCLQVV